MIYKMELSDSVDTMIIPLLEVPIIDNDITGLADNTTIDGNVFRDYLWLKKQYVQKWSIMCQAEYEQLRGFWTRQFGNAEVPFYRLFYGDNVYEDKTGATTDGYLQINNDAPLESPLTLTKLTGNAEQDGTPTPDAPIPVNVVSGAQTVKITGKNPIDPSTLASSVFENNLTNVYYYDANLHFALKAGQTYTLSAYVEQIDATPYGFSALIGTATGSRAELGTMPNLTTVGGRVSVSFTVSQAQIDSAGGNNLFMRLPRYTSPTTTHYKISDIQLELGTQRSDYEPYQAQSYEINLGGTNLLDQSTLIAGYVQSNGYPTTSQTQGEMRTDYMEVEPSTTYTFSIQATTDTYEPWYGWCEYTAQTPTAVIGTRQGGGTLPATFTTSATAKYIIFSARNLQHATKVQLEKGSKATPYAPYTTYAYELAKIGTYQDYIYKDGGKWYKHAEVGKFVLDGGDYAPGKQTWTKTDTGNDCSFWFRNYLTDAYVGKCQKYCNNFTYTSVNYVDSPSPVLCENDSISPTSFMFIFKVPSTLASTIAEWKTWLASHPTTVYYALATPTDTEITDAELLAQLNTISELYQGTNNLWLIPSAGAQGKMEVQYRLNYEQETDIVPKTPVVLTLTDGGVINPCGCRENIQLTMRETTQGNSES